MTLCSAHWPGLWSPTWKTGNEKWDMAGWGQGSECILYPWQAQVWTSDPFYLLDTLSLQFPGCQRPRETHSPDTKWDLIGRDRDCTHRGRLGQEGRGSANKITVVHDMQGVLKCLTSCQEKVPGFVSGTNPAWQGSDSLAVADRTRQLQPDTFPLPHIHCRPLFYSLPSHLRLSSQVIPRVCVCVCFHPLSLIANLLFLCSDAACTQR